jgi:hypothetical protein
MTPENQTSSPLDRIMTKPKDNPSFDEIVEHLHQVGVRNVDLKEEDIDFAKFSVDWDKTVNIVVPCASGGLTKCKIFHPVSFFIVDLDSRSGAWVKAFHKEPPTDKSSGYESEIPNSLASVERIFSSTDPATNMKFIAFTGTIGGNCIKEDGSIGPIPH